MPSSFCRGSRTEGLKPPVAILVYQVDEPRRAVYFPFAVFSPEWQTLAWAARAQGAGAVHGSAAIAPVRPRRRREDEEEDQAERRVG